VLKLKIMPLKVILGAVYEETIHKPEFTGNGYKYTSLELPVHKKRIATHGVACDVVQCAVAMTT
jgi:hypothetical protein